MNLEQLPALQIWAEFDNKRSSCDLRKASRDPCLDGGSVSGYDCE